MCPRTQKQFDEIRKQSTSKIADAALELFADNGYTGTSIAMIAKKAGISKGLIYNYFDSKHELLVHILNNAFDLVHDIIDEEEIRTREPQELFSEIIRNSLELAEENKKYFRLFTSLMLHPEMLDEALEIGNLVINKIQKLSKELFVRLGSDDPERDAYLFDSLLDGISMQIMMNYNPKSPDEIHKFLCDKFLIKQQSAKTSSGL